MCVFCQILGQIHPNQFSQFLISQKQAVQDCAAARESSNACGEGQYAIKQKNALMNCDATPKVATAAASLYTKARFCS